MFAPEHRIRYATSMALDRNDPAFYRPEKIIDIHAHPRGPSGSSLDEERLDELVEYAQAMNVIKMGSLGEVLFRRYGYSAVEISWLNDRNADLASHHSDFFFPFCFLDPTLGKEVVRDEVRRCYEKHGFRAIKLEITCNVSNPATAPVFEIAGELGIPVLAHSVSTDHVGDREHQSDPEDVAFVAERFPEVTIIMAHLTGAGVRGVQAIESHDNVMVDTSGMQPDTGIVEYAVARLGAERVIFGSDMCGRDLPVQIAQVLAADIDDDAKEKVFFRNTASLIERASANESAVGSKEKKR